MLMQHFVSFFECAALYRCQSHAARGSRFGSNKKLLFDYLVFHIMAYQIHHKKRVHSEHWIHHQVFNRIKAK